MEVKPSALTRSFLIAAALFVLMCPFVIRSAFYQHIMIMIFMYGLLAVSWDLMGGYANLFSFGHGAFFGIGAYTSTVLLIRWGINPWIGMIIGGCLSGIVGLLISYPTSRLRGHYFAIATLAFLFVTKTLIENWRFVGAAQGLTIPMAKESSLINFQFHGSKIPYYYIMLGLLTLGVVVAKGVIKSRVGYYLRALRESPEVAQSLGVNTAKYRLIAIALSAFLAAISGSFYAQYVLYIDPPSAISLHLSVQVVLIAVFGGTGTINGPLLGAVILIPLINLIGAWLGGAGRGIAFMVFGAVIVIMCLIQPDGLIKYFEGWKLSNRRENEAA
jgi:branched-chain amino acid transport system permease protein